MKQEQIEVLKYLVLSSDAGTELSRRIVAFLIEKSNLLSTDVCITLSETSGDYEAEEIHQAGRGVDALQHSSRPGNINQLLMLMGVEKIVTMHYGDFNPENEDNTLNTDGQFAGWEVASPGAKKEGMPMRYTFWLSERPYSDEATLLTATKEELLGLKVEDPHPYKRLLHSAE